MPRLGTYAYDRTCMHFNLSTCLTQFVLLNTEHRLCQDELIARDVVLVQIKRAKSANKSAKKSAKIANKKCKKNVFLGV